MLPQGYKEQTRQHNTKTNMKYSTKKAAHWNGNFYFTTAYYQRDLGQLEQGEQYNLVQDMLIFGHRRDKAFFAKILFAFFFYNKNQNQ